MVHSSPRQGSTLVPREWPPRYSGYQPAKAECWGQVSVSTTDGVVLLRCVVV